LNKFSKLSGSIAFGRFLNILLNFKKNGKNLGQKYFLSFKKKKSSSVHIKNYSSREKKSSVPRDGIPPLEMGSLSVGNGIPFLENQLFFSYFYSALFFSGMGSLSARNRILKI